MGLIGTLFMLVQTKRLSEDSATKLDRSRIKGITIGAVLLALGIGIFFLTDPYGIRWPFSALSMRPESTLLSKPTSPASETTVASAIESRQPSIGTQEAIHDQYSNVLNRFFAERKTLADGGSFSNRKSLVADLNGDGKADMISEYEVEGVGGGNSYCLNIALFLMTDIGLVFASELSAGWNLSVYILSLVSIENGLIRVSRECNEFQPADSCSQDSIGTIFFAARHGNLKQTTPVFQQFAKVADSLHDAGDTLGSFMAYKTAMANAAILSDSTNCLASLSQSALELLKYDEARQYCETLLKAAPKSRWAKDLLVQISEAEANATRK